MFRRLAPVVIVVIGLSGGACSGGASTGDDAGDSDPTAPPPATVTREELLDGIASTTLPATVVPTTPTTAPPPASTTPAPAPAPTTFPTEEGDGIGTVPPGATDVRIYAVFAGTGDVLPGVTLQESVLGECLAPSDRVGRNEAYRCLTADSTISDPCFASPARDMVACLTGGPDDPVALMLVTTLPANEGRPGLAPWYVVLTDGTSCARPAGAGLVVNGEPASFMCSDGRAIVGEADESTPAWTVQLHDPSTGATAPAAVAIAYN
jgi:hypothetical protein